MEKNESQEHGKLTAEIDDAVDDLFSEFEKIEIDPTTSEVKKVSQDQDSQSEAPKGILSLENDEETMDLDFTDDLGHNEIINTADDLLSQSDEALLSLEWEVTPQNISNAKDLLAEISLQFESKQIPAVSQALKLMNRILDTMEESPLSVPTTGPKALQETLEVFKKIAADDLSENDIQSSLNNVIPLLRASLPQQQEQEDSPDEFSQETVDLDLEMGDETTDSPQPSFQAEEEITVETPAAEPPVTATQTTPTEPLPVTDSTPDQMTTVIQTNIAMLDQCIIRIKPLENLFAKTPGYEKLHFIHEKLREQLELQQMSLENGLQGNFTPLTKQKISPLKKVRVSQKSSDSRCPWQRLTIAKWKGALVAFLPEQIAYLSDNTINVQDKFGKIEEFPLAKLKKWPWSKIKPLLTGDIGELEEAELKRTILPVLHHPGVFQTFTEEAEDNHILILSNKETHGVIFLDTATEQIMVSPDWSWEPSQRRGEIIAGHLKIQSDHLPVLDLNPLR
ncbi:hypothetical protein ACFL6N_04140 [Thermodesulfobacteriota bacterium]